MTLALAFALFAVTTLSTLSRGLSATTCSVEASLSQGAVTFSGTTIVLVQADCTLLAQGRNASISLLTHLNITNTPSSTSGSVDLQFASDVVRLPSGGVLSISRLRVLNARVRVSQPLPLAAFSSSAQTLNQIVLETDCASIAALTQAAASLWPGFVGTTGPGYLYVALYAAGQVSLSSVNFTCSQPAVQTLQDGASGGGTVESAAVATSLQLLNVLVRAMQPGNPLVLRLTSNMSVDSSYWPKPFVMQRNVSIVGDPDAWTVVDLRGATSAVTLAPTVHFTVEYLYLMNLGPLRGTLVDLGMLSLFSLPVWFFNFTRIPDAPQLHIKDVLLTLPRNEYAYFAIWTLVVTSDILEISEAAQRIKSTTPIIQLGTSASRTSLNFKHMRSTGADILSSSITYEPPSAFPVTVTETYVPEFSTDVTDNLTQVVAYGLSELMDLLQQMQDRPPKYQTAIFLLRNITIDPAVWPAGGYNISTPLLLLAQLGRQYPTWIDFNRLPRFLNVAGTSPSCYVFVHGLHLLNLPNALQLAPGSRIGSAPPGGVNVSALGLSDVTVWMSNIAAPDAWRGPAPVVFLNQSSIVVTYAEFKQVYSAVSKDLGTSSVGNGTAVGSHLSYSLSRVVANSIEFISLLGWGWSGYRSIVTYVYPDGAPVLYSNVFDPPWPPPAPPGLAAPRGGGGDLVAWQVALIVVGSVVAVALLGGLVTWRVVASLRREVEAVKSAGSDKRSGGTSAGSMSGEHDGNGAVGGSSHHARGGGKAGPAAGTGGGGTGGSGISGGAAPVAAVGAANVMSEDSTSMERDRPPLEMLHCMMAALTNEIDDRHLTILEVIGQGGFGVVYKGQWKGLTVAVKTITFQDRVAGGEKAQARAILEAAISSSLAHPNVVTTYSYDIKPLTVHGVGSGEGNVNGGSGGFRITADKQTVLDWKLYLIQEFCDGGSLRTAVLKRKFFDMKKAEPRVEMVLDTSLELCGGLMHLHERNIIHGDLNPNNVLLKRDPSKKYGAVCKIADFGLSIKMGADQSHISNMRRGTPFYTCPHILARGNMTKAADVYSFGVMMWEMYHSCMAYRNTPNNGFAPREAFPHFARRAPAEFARLVGACLDPEPAARPPFAQVAAQLTSMLEALRRGALRTGEDDRGPDPVGDAAHAAGCTD